MTSITPAMRLVIKLSSFQIRLQKKLNQELCIHGVSFTEFMVLYHLKSAPNSSMRRIDLAEKIGMSASGVTRLLKPMQKIGLVEKEINSRDARVSIVKLTRIGLEIFSDTKISFEQSAGLLMRPLKSNSLKEYEKLTDALLVD